MKLFELDQVSSFDIDALIKKSKYSKRDISAATEGLCGTFAIALMHFLKTKGVASRLVLFVDEPTYNANTTPNATHILKRTMVVSIGGMSPCK